MVDIPKEIEKYLVCDEVVEKDFKLDNQWTAYASTRRLFFKKRSTVRDIDYSHISSIEYQSRPKWIAVLVGILSAIVGYFLQQNTSLGWALIIAGIVLIGGGFVWKKQSVVLSVVGLGNWPFSGHRDTIDSLFKLVREHRI